MNHIIINGNLTKDPELRTTKDGIPVCGFTVAVNRKQTQAQRQNGEKPEADFFNVTAWRGLGENCAKFLEKGKKVAVVGRVSVRTWETQDGKHGASLEVLAEDVEFLSPKVSDVVNDAPAPADAQTQMQIVDTDDLPFD